MNDFSVDDYFSQVKRAASKSRIPLSRLCQRAGVAYSTIWRYQKGRAKMTFETADKLMSALNASETETQD